MIGPGWTFIRCLMMVQSFNWAHGCSRDDPSWHAAYLQDSMPCAPHVADIYPPPPSAPDICLPPDRLMPPKNCRIPPLRVKFKVIELRFRDSVITVRVRFLLLGLRLVVRLRG